MMIPGVPATLLLADGEGITAVITILIVVIGWIANLVSNKNQKGPPVANRPRPPARPRDERLQQEISIFIEDAGGQRSRKPPARPTPAARPKRPAQQPAAGKPARRTRPGEELATRQAPVTESLGTGVKQHLSTYMSDKVSREVQQRLAPRVEEKVAEDLGRPVATAAPAGAAPAPVRAGQLLELLRNRTGVQQAIVMNLILSPPVSRTRSSRR